MPSTPWLKVLLAVGAILAVALLVQTIINYRYVSNSLILQDARRVAAERVRNVERAARLARPQDAESFRVILEDVRQESADQVAGIALIQSSGAIVAASGQTPAATASGQPEAGRAAMTRESRDGRTVVVGTFPCRCRFLRRTAAESTESDPGPLRVQVALFEDSLSAPFARVRRNAILSASAALALLVALSLIAMRAGAYVRGKQLETEMELARQVQKDLLPSAGAGPPGVDVAADCLPSSLVGGDFYDIVSLPEGRVSFVLGDVSGHGVAPALLMGLMHGAMSNPPWGASEDPDRAAARLNHLLLAKSSGERFASLFWCAYDPALRELRYVNAGHLPALLLRRQTGGDAIVERLADGGPVLGLLPGAVYRTVPVAAGDGDLLVLFSDGITEAPCRQGEPFGEERLVAAIQQQRDRPARAICDAVLGAVSVFTAGRPAPDDQTLVVVRLWRAA
jgi:hypothetical protein